jgi:hypothetical protein
MELGSCYGYGMRLRINKSFEMIVDSLQLMIYTLICKGSGDAVRDFNHFIGGYEISI